MTNRQIILASFNKEINKLKNWQFIKYYTTAQTSNFL